MELTNGRELEQAAEVIRIADALVIAAGAGMGIDSGLPDFRGPEGFWRAYPPLADLNLRFEQIANPRWFERDPALAWGFYGHRLNLYQETEPHQGFTTLWRWTQRMTERYFIYTSNVDGHFQKAGFGPDRVVECHGSINRFQCCIPCHEGSWDGSSSVVIVDSETLRASQPLPTCPMCGGLARPNLLMFNDWAWDESGYHEPYSEFTGWLSRLFLEGKQLVVVECGAGSAIPSVRYLSENLLEKGAYLIRINPGEPEAPRGGISLPVGALTALQAIDALLT